MMPSVSSPVVLSLQKRWTDVRHVALSPRTFQLRASRDRGRRLGLTGQNVDISHNPLNTGRAVARWFSTCTSSRTAAQGLTMEKEEEEEEEEEEEADGGGTQSEVLRVPVRPSENHDIPMAQDASPPSASPSSAFFPLQQFKGHHDHVTGVKRTASWDWMLPQVPGVAQKNLQIEPMPRSGHAVSSSDTGMANAIHADRHQSGKSLEPNVTSRLNWTSEVRRRSPFKKENRPASDPFVEWVPSSSPHGTTSRSAESQLNEERQFQRTSTFDEKHGKTQESSAQWTTLSDRSDSETPSAMKFQLDDQTRRQRSSAPADEHHFVKHTPTQRAPLLDRSNSGTSSSEMYRFHDQKRLRKSSTPDDEHHVIRSSQTAWVPLYHRPHNTTSPLQKDESKAEEWLQGNTLPDRDNDTTRHTTFQRTYTPDHPDSIISSRGNHQFKEEEQRNYGLAQHIRDSVLPGQGVFPASPSPPKTASTSFVANETMKRFMRRVPQSPVIVTATNTKEPRYPFGGATVSSFTTVTLEPEVIVSLNLKLPSATFDAIEISNRFEVNLLKSNSKGAQTAHEFAQGRAASPFGDAAKQASTLAARRQYNISDSAPPALYGRHGLHDPVAFSISCKYMTETTVRLGDHAVIFGVVENVPETSHNRDATESTTCLAYIDGRYGQVEPLSKQPQDDFRQVDFHEDSSVLSTAQSLDSTSRSNILALEIHAVACMDSFRKSFLPEACLVGLKPQTKSLVRKLRRQSTDVLDAIRGLSRTVKHSSTPSSSHSSLAAEIQQLITFYFIFCGSRHFWFPFFGHLPLAIKEHLKDFQDRAVEINSSIKAIQVSLNITWAPPHPLYALQKAPSSVDSALPYIRNYVEHFITSQAFSIKKFSPLPVQVATESVSYFTRMQLMRAWLGHGSDSFLDLLLEMPSHYLVRARNLLVLCSNDMLLGPDLPRRFSMLPHRRFRESLLEYEKLGHSLWKPFRHMTVPGRHQTMSAVMGKWARLDAASRQWREETPMPVRTSTPTIEGKVYEDPIEEAKVAKEEKTEVKDTVLKLLDDAPVNKYSCDSTVPNRADNDQLMNHQSSIAECSQNSTGEADVHMPYMSFSKKLNEAASYPQLRLQEVTSVALSSSNGHDTNDSRKKAESSRKPSTSKSKSQSRHVIPSAPVPASGLLRFPILGKIVTAINAWSGKRSFSECAESSRQSLQTSESDELKVSLPGSKRSVSAINSASSALTDDAEGDAADKHVAADQSSEGGTGNRGIDKTTKNEKIFENVYPFIRPGFIDAPPFRRIWNRVAVGQLSSDSMERHGIASTTKKEKMFAKVHPLIRPSSANNPPFRKLSSDQNFTRKIEISDQKAQPHEVNNQENTSINELLERILIRKHIVRDINLSRSSNGPHPTKTTTDNDNAEQTTDIASLIKALLYGSSHRSKKHLSTNNLDEQSDSTQTKIRKMFERKIRHHIFSNHPSDTESPPKTMTTEQYQKFQESQKAARRQAMNSDIDDVMGEIEMCFKSKQGSGEIVDKGEMSNDQQRKESSSQVFGLQELMEASERFADDKGGIRGKSKKGGEGTSDGPEKSVEGSSSNNQVFGLQELMQASERFVDEEDGLRVGKSKKKKKKKRREL